MNNLVELVYQVATDADFRQKFMHSLDDWSLTKEEQAGVMAMSGTLALPSDRLSIQMADLADDLRGWFW